jgi:histidinol dehydrogenase
MAPRFLKSKELTTESTTTANKVPEIVKGVISAIRSGGNAAVREYSEKFDHWSPESFKLSEEKIVKIISTLPEQTVKDIKEVQHNVRRFAEAQRRSIMDFELEIEPGIHLGQKNIPIAAVGTYVSQINSWHGLISALDISQEVDIPSSLQPT